MASHPYISGAGNIEAMIKHLRSHFPPIVNSETVKKFQLAPNNESYVINALQFIGVLDADSKRTDEGQSIFVLPDEKFADEFGALIQESYKDLFETRGEAAWLLDKKELTAYFRTTDKTSEAIGARQASVFQMFSALSGHAATSVPKAKSASGGVKKAKRTPKKEDKARDVQINAAQGSSTQAGERQNAPAFTIRIEINLPDGGTKETYDNIFKSINENFR